MHIKERCRASRNGQSCTWQPFTSVSQPPPPPPPYGSPHPHCMTAPPYDSPPVRAALQGCVPLWLCAPTARLWVRLCPAGSSARC